MTGTNPSRRACLGAALLLTVACAAPGGAPAPRRPAVALSDCGPAPEAGPIFLETQLTHPPRMRHAGPMVYPADLRANGVDGTVRAAFVIDTLGAAVPSSLRMLSAGDIAFERSARETIMQSRWDPGAVQGRLVAVCAIATLHYTP